MFSSQPSYLGVDIGASATKIVELANEGKRPRLVTYGIVEEPLNLVGTVDPRQEPARVGAALRALVAKSRVTTTKAFASLPTFSVFTSIINIPQVAGKDLAAAVRWEAKKIVPLPIDDMVLDWKPLVEAGVGKSAVLANVEKDGGTGTRILLTAAAKDLGKKYIEVFRAAGLQLMSLETEAFALIRSLVGPEDGVVMVVDVGAVNTDISVVDHGIPFLNRSIDTGGLVITKTLSESMAVTLDEAEQMKRDLGNNIAEGSQGVPEALQAVVEPIVNELSYCVSLYERQRQALEKTTATPLSGSPAISKVIMTGGCSALAGLTDHLSKRLNIRVISVNPWSRIMVPKELEPELATFGSRLSIAIGLAMRDIV